MKSRITVALLVLLCISVTHCYINLKRTSIQYKCIDVETVTVWFRFGKELRMTCSGKDHMYVYPQDDVQIYRVEYSGNSTTKRYTDTAGTNNVISGCISTLTIDNSASTFTQRESYSKQCQHTGEYITLLATPY